MHTLSFIFSCVTALLTPPLLDKLRRAVRSYSVVCETGLLLLDTPCWGLAHP